MTVQINAGSLLSFSVVASSGKRNTDLDPGWFISEKILVKRYNAHNRIAPQLSESQARKRKCFPFWITDQMWFKISQRTIDETYLRRHGRKGEYTPARGLQSLIPDWKTKPLDLSSPLRIRSLGETFKPYTNPFEQVVTITCSIFFFLRIFFIFITIKLYSIQLSPKTKVCQMSQHLFIYFFTVIISHLGHFFYAWILEW